MVMVNPLGYGTAGGGIGGPDMIAQFAKAMLQEVMPRVEKAYNVSRDRNQRAIAGLSMGGAEAIYTGLNNMDRFAWVASFSGAYVMWPGAGRGGPGAAVGAGRGAAPAAAPAPAAPAAGGPRRARSITRPRDFPEGLPHAGRQGQLTAQAPVDWLRAERFAAGRQPAVRRVAQDQRREVHTGGDPRLRARVGAVAPLCRDCRAHAVPGEGQVDPAGQAGEAMPRPCHAPV